MADRVLALVHYYAREGYARQLQTVCAEVLKKRTGDPLLTFWRAYGLLLEGASAEALRELASVRGVADLELAAAAASLVAHEGARVPDHDAIMELQTKLEVEERMASDAASLHLAQFYLVSKSRERARGLAERVLRGQQGQHDGAAVAAAGCLLGWVILAQQQEDEYDVTADVGELEEALGHFEAALAQQPDDVEALLGKARCLEMRKDGKARGAALDVVTELTVRAPWFLPGLVERGRLLLAQGDWEQVLEVANRVLAAEPGNAPATSWMILHAITRDGNNKAAARQLQDLFAALNRQEPKNAELYYRTCRPFARLACSDAQLLATTCLMAERAAQLKPDHAPYLVEVGVQKLMLDEVAAAAERFTAALAVDELSLEATAGQLEATIAAGDLDEAASQVLFLEEMYSSHAALSSRAGGGVLGGALGEPPQLTYLKGLLAWKRGDTGEALGLLERAIAGQFEAAAEFPLGMELFTVLHAGRVAGAVRLLLSSIGGDPRAPTEAPSPLISKCNRALAMLCRHAPGMVEAQLLHARTLYLNGQLDAAQRKAADVLRAYPEDHTAHMLVCSVYVHQDKPELALSALDQAVAANLSVRETPLFHIVTARVAMAGGRLEDARKTLESAMSLPGVRTAMTAQQRQRLGRRVAEPSLHERATVYLLLAEVLSKMSKLADAPEAKKYITDALREFEGTSEEVRVTVADCELAIARGDVEGALKRLRRIPATSPHYTKARMAMADIYLRHRKDRASYIKCYLDLVDKAQDFDAYCMLGEAFMQIQEPEKAVKAFESALELNPKDGDLTARIARALVTTHDYQAAIEYYNKALYNSRGAMSLQLELANLLLRLRQWPQATTGLTRILDRAKEPPGSVENLTTDVEAYTLLAKVHKGMGDMDAYVATQQRALDTQRQLLLKLRGELPETLAAQRERTAALCFELAEHAQRDRKFDRAVEFYNEALRQHEGHLPSMLALARLHLANGNTEACQQQCVVLLKADPDNQEAGIMLAEIMFHKENYDSSIYHFEQLLERSPNHYGALSNLVGLLRRAGRLDDVPKYLDQALAAAPKAVMDAGYHYCRGLYNRYINNAREALREFNLARKDRVWGTPAVLHMAEVYLNPDNDAVWEEKDNADTPESTEAVATARSLLAQVRPQDQSSQRFRVLECYAMMASRDKADVEAALSRMLDMANQDPNNVPVLLAMATGFMMLKQTPKARNQLKRVQKVQYKPDEAEEFERSWLLLADIHIQGGKYDLAQDLCQKCLKYNKSCSRAWEVMGQVMEREQAYKDAAEHYEAAWKHENMASAQVGFKLAFNYLKAKRFVEAIDVCHRVIKAFPDYPKIRKEILEKARQGLKP